VNVTRFSWAGAGRLAAAFLAAVVATALVGSVLQTQINLSSITGLGVPVPPGMRATTTAQDAARFGPVMAAIAAAAFLPAFLAAWALGRTVPGLRVAIYAVAGAAGLWAAFTLMGLFTPMPTLVAAVRGTKGLLAMSATGLVGGLLFAVLRRRRAA